MSTTDEVILLVTRAETYRLAGEYEKAINHIKQALAILHEVGETEGEAPLLGGLGQIYMKLGRYKQAMDSFQQALLIIREITQDKELETHALRGLCQSYLKLEDKGPEDWNMIFGYLEELAILGRETGDSENAAWAFAALGELNFELCRWEKALAFLGQAKTLGYNAKSLDDKITISCNGREVDFVIDPLIITAREEHDLRKEGLALSYKGDRYHNLGTDGSRRKGIEYAEQALSILEQIGDPLAIKVQKKLSLWHKQSRKKRWQFWK